MDQARQQIVDSIKSHSNILVTVSTDPSVDELSAALGLTILLNNLDKRATSVFSGTVPPAINFLEPGKTFESSADSLRDFIIALDKEKADHLRYKVEGDVVKVFITPYKTKLSQSDLNFSQGDYNVELVVALGVQDQAHLDKALEAHGKILHDATVVTVTVGEKASNLGSIDWHDASASSLSELVVSLIDGLKQGDQPLLDQQISTALLTGIVSSTDRFSNELTSSRVMTMAAQLMAAGANQQLIAAKLEEAHAIKPMKPSSGVTTNSSASDKKPQTPSNELTIDRSDSSTKDATPPVPQTDGDSTSDNSAAAEPPAQKTSTGSTEEQAQNDLEKQLAGLTGGMQSGTVENIEKQLDQAAKSEEKPTEPAPVAPEPTKGPEMPDFEATGEQKPVVPPQEPVQSEPSALPPLPTSPEPAPPPPVSSPQIIKPHDGSPRSSAEGPASPINGIQDGSNQEQPAADPLAAPQIPSPALQTDKEAGGTPEGAAILTASDAPDGPAATSPLTPHFSMPSLPPLPPLPADTSATAPPPPPPPPLGQPSVGGPMPSGAVSGDVFGDADASQATAPSAPPEPGQFKIPGQS